MQIIAKSLLISCISVISTLTISLTCMAQSKPIIHHTFEDGGNGWSVFGNAGKIVPVKELAPGGSKGSLQFEYALAKGQIDVLALPVPVDSLAKAKSFTFWLKPERSGTMAMSLNEHDGGRYLALFSVTGEKWQKISLAPVDFTLSSEPNDPKDADGKLDMETVDSIAIVDIMQIFAQAGDPNIEKIMGIKLGGRKFLINDFIVSDVPLPETQPTPGVLEDFSRSVLQWFKVGNMEISKHTGAPLDGTGIKVTYNQEVERFFGLVRKLKEGALKGSDSIAVSIASDKKLTLMFQLEQKGGVKFNSTIEVPGDQTARTYTFKYKEMAPSGDSKDPNADLIPADVTQIILADLNGLTGLANGNTSLYIGKIAAKVSSKP